MAVATEGPVNSTTNASTTPLTLAPEVIDRLHLLQKEDRAVSVDEILKAANLDHLAQPSQSKSSETRNPSTLPPPLPQPRPEKSASTLTLSERRRVPMSSEKLRLYSKITAQQRGHDQGETADGMQERVESTLKRLEEENAKLPPQDSEDYLLARLERQNMLLNADPKSVCIESNRLKADFSTVRQLVSDNTMATVTSDEDTTELDWDFWQCLVDDFPTAAAKLPHLLAAKLKHGGIPHRLRGIIWQAMAQSTSTNLETIYDRLLTDLDPSPYDRVIKRDLSRTFPSVDMFKLDGGEGQQAMGRLLKAYSVYDAHVGYCQGLAFLVGPLLMTMPEQQAFCVFVRLMETYDMRTMFTLNMEGLHLRLHQFQTLLTQLCPRLDAHLAQHSINPAMYASQWYLTLFAYSFPISLVLRIYDLALAEGAIETIMRVAIAVMQKNEEALLSINDFEQLIMYLSSRRLYEEAYASNTEAVIADTMALSTMITKTKMDEMAEAHNKELQQEKEHTHQVLAVRFGKTVDTAATAAPVESKPSKRESWFSWGNDSAKRTESPVTESAPSLTTPAVPQDNAVPLLHSQIEELVSALAQLQKEHSAMSEELVSMKMREMNHGKLAKRNAALEKRVKKYKHRLSQTTSATSVVSVPTEEASTETSSFCEKAEQLAVLEQDSEFRSFVDSLRMSGDFGALIAGALSFDVPTEEETNNACQEVMPVAEAEVEEDEDDDTDEQEEECHVTMAAAPKDSNERRYSQDPATDDVTTELVALKLANFEMGQKYEQLCEQHEALQRELRTANDRHAEDTDCISKLETELEQMDEQRLQLLEEHEDLLDKSLASKKMASELQQEKVELAAEVEALTDKVRTLEDEKREYLMPRDSFADEVFAAHHTLFGKRELEHIYAHQHQPNRRHTLQIGDSSVEYKAKYLESDLRCRELEKLLAEAKVKLADLESLPSNSPRTSLQCRRTSSIQAKRTSLSMLARGSTPYSSSEVPSPTLERRESTDSLASTMSSYSTNKRSSMYSRLWCAFGAPNDIPKDVGEVSVVDGGAAL